MGGGEDRNWSDLVARRYGWRHVSFAEGGTGWLNGGRRGDNPFGSRIRMHAVSQTRPDILFLTTSSNDLNLARSSESVQQRKERLAAAVENGVARYRRELPRSKIVLIDIVPSVGASGGSLDAEALFGEALARYYVNLIEPPSSDGWFATDRRRYIGKDGLHPTDAGHQHLAEQIIAQLNDLHADSWPQVYHDWSQAAAP